MSVVRVPRRVAIRDLAKMMREFRDLSAPAFRQWADSVLRSSVRLQKDRSSRRS